MAAEQIVDRPVALLFEPIEPPTPVSLIGGGHRPGWLRGSYQQRRARNVAWFRNHADDPHGAQVQEAILHYYLLGESRSQIARAYGFGIRGTQGHLSGTNWQAYSAPVLAWLDLYNLRRQAKVGYGRLTRAERDHRLAVAGQRVMGQVLTLLAAGRPVPPLLLRDMRLLSGAWQEGRP